MKFSIGLIGFITCLTFSILACEPPQDGLEFDTALESRTGELTTNESGEEDDFWAMSATGAPVYVEAERFCAHTQIELKAGDRIEALESGDGFVVYSAAFGGPDEGETLKCNCTDGDATACTPVWHKKKGAGCVMGKGCTTCTKKIVPKPAPKPDDEMEKAPEKADASALRTSKEPSEAVESGGISLKELKEEASMIALSALDNAATKQSRIEEACGSLDFDKELFIQERDDLIAAVYGDRGIPLAFERMNVEMENLVVYARVSFAGKVVAFPIPKTLATKMPSFTVLGKPKNCSCNPPPKPVDDPKKKDEKGENADAATAVKSVGSKCELDSTWGYYSCENDGCKVSCDMNF